MQDLKTYKAEDKAVEGRSQNYLQEWEKNKPVEGALRPDAALQKLAIFESKYSRQWPMLNSNLVLSILM